MGTGGAPARLQTACLHHRCPPSGDTSRGCSMEGVYTIPAGWGWKSFTHKASQLPNVFLDKKCLLELGNWGLGQESGADQTSRGPFSGDFYCLGMTSLVGLQWERGMRSERLQSGAGGLGEGRMSAAWGWGGAVGRWWEEGADTFEKAHDAI